MILIDFFLDSVYSERYMGQPDLSGNFRGYQDSNIIQKFRNLQRGNGTDRKVLISYQYMNPIFTLTLIDFI